MQKVLDDLQEDWSAVLVDDVRQKPEPETSRLPLSPLSMDCIDGNSMEGEILASPRNNKEVDLAVYPPMTNTIPDQAAVPHDHIVCQGK